MRPHVAINALFLHYPHSGTGRYLAHLIRLGEHWCDLTLLGARAFPPAAGRASPPKLVGTPFDRRAHSLAKVWLEQVALTRAARRADADVLHHPYFAAPIVAGLPTVATVHDLVPVLRPEYRQTALQRLYTTSVTLGLRAASIVITDSQASAHDLTNRLGRPQHTIRVIPLGVDPRFRPIESPADAAWGARVRERLGVGQRYVLYVGGFDRRKNVDRLVQAFATAKRSGRLPHQLVLVGARRPGSPFFYDPAPDVEREGIADAVVLPGRIDDDEVRALHQGADVFVFPSGYEGFGLPPLEAMAAGAPVICSSASSLPEVVGDAAVLVDPDNNEELVEAILRVVANVSLRDDLSQRGLVRAARFTWEATVEGTAAVYRELTGGGR